LHARMEYCSATADEDRGVRCSEQHMKELSDECHRTGLELRKATGIGAFIISDEVADVLSKLEARPGLDPDPQEHALYEVMDAEYEADKQALGKIRSLAKKDLSMK